MSLRELPFNDMMAQVSKKLIKTSDEEEEKRIDEIRNCQHLFVKLRSFDLTTYEGLDLSIIECVHCGVTNKYKELERVMEKYRHSLDYYVLTKLHYVDVKYNDETIESRLFDEIKKENDVLNMMSDEVIRTFHPGVLYDAAKIISPDASIGELFEIMKELNHLETLEERNKLNNIFDATDLIERYKNAVKVLKK